MPCDPRTADLVARAQRGEEGAFGALTRLYLRAAYSVALAIVGRPADAEDVAQDALLLAFERLGTCREPERFGGWLLRIVRNQAHNWLARRHLRDVPGCEIDADFPDEAASPGSTVARDRLLAALAAISPVRREVVLLHDMEEWTHPEIAAALQISEVTSRQHLFQARRQLRERLGDTASMGDEP